MAKNTVAMVLVAITTASAFIFAQQQIVAKPKDTRTLRQILNDTTPLDKLPQFIKVFHVKYQDRRAAAGTHRTWYYWGNMKVAPDWKQCSWFSFTDSERFYYVLDLEPTEEQVRFINQVPGHRGYWQLRVVKPGATIGGHHPHIVHNVTTQTLSVMTTTRFVFTDSLERACSWDYQAAQLHYLGMPSVQGSM